MCGAGQVWPVGEIAMWAALLRQECLSYWVIWYAAGDAI